MTHQGATAEAVYAAGMYQAAMIGRLADFERDMRAMLRRTVAT